MSGLIFSTWWAKLTIKNDNLKEQYTVSRKQTIAILYNLNHCNSEAPEIQNTYTKTKIWHFKLFSFCFVSSFTDIFTVFWQRLRHSKDWIKNGKRCVLARTHLKVKENKLKNAWRMETIMYITLLRDDTTWPHTIMKNVLSSSSRTETSIYFFD